MFIQQCYTGCLSEAAYYIESEGKAAIIDPMRDIDAYLELARERGAQITHIFETHFHADFVSGHLDLSKVTGAPIIYGPGTATAFPVTIASDGERFRIGALTVEVLHTPGHTLESSCYLLLDEAGKPHAVFTGDTLFVGDVGRPDLSQKGSEWTMAELAGMLYESLHQKLMPLPDDVLVYPAHGAGSSCGKHLSKETYSTIGVQKRSNYALLAPTKEAFIKAVTEGLNAPPLYFPINARINKEGYDPLEEVLGNALQPLSLNDFTALQQEGAIVVDTRAAGLFAEGFIPESIFIGLEGRFAEWAGSLLPYDKTLLLITEAGKEKETIIRLARVGFSRIAGYLEGGFDTWASSGASVDMVLNVEADELALDLPFDNHLVVLDVRREAEYADGHVRQAVNLPLIEMIDPGKISSIDDRDNLYIYCAGGYRSMIAASLLKRQGLHNLRNIIGGWTEIREQPGIEIVKDNSVLN